MITKPMKAATVYARCFDDVAWPVLGSPKIDGIRCLIHPELGPVTMSFKPVPNKYIRESLARMCKGTNFDGELTTLNPETMETLPFNQIQSQVMSHGGKPHYLYRVFDCFRNPEAPFSMRHHEARIVVQNIQDHLHVDIVEHECIASAETFREYANACIVGGYEGAMIRSLDGPYKSGRSTLRQGWLLKYKEWEDDEGTVIGFYELMHNSNEDVRDVFDHAKRSSAKAGMLPMGTLGGLILKTKWGELRVGSGFDAAQRQELWNRRGVNILGLSPEDLSKGVVGRTVTFKYQAHGMQNKPRFPIFKSFREAE